jgi:hypothetical protein
VLVGLIWRPVLTTVLEDDRFRRDWDEANYLNDTAYKDDATE